MLNILIKNSYKNALQHWIIFNKRQKNTHSIVSKSVWNCGQSFLTSYIYSQKVDVKVHWPENNRFSRFSESFLKLNCSFIARKRHTKYFTFRNLCVWLFLSVKFWKINQNSPKSRVTEKEQCIFVNFISVKQTKEIKLEIKHKTDKYLKFC